MFLRVVRMKLREGSVWAFREYYEGRIVPALEATKGCVFAALLRPAAAQGDSCDSLTLWESAADADAYVDGGLYDELLDGADPFLASVTEWRADLSRLEPERRPPLPDPEVETFPVEVAHEAEPDGAPTLFLRMVDHRIEPARFEAFCRTYDEEIAPALLETPGCLAAYFVEGSQGKSRALSITFWRDEASAIRYESTGRFDVLAAKVQPFLSGVYQWRLSLSTGSVDRTIRGRDLDVAGFHVLAGRRLERRGG